MTFSGPFEDRLQIRERLDAYSDAVIRGDVEDYLAHRRYQLVMDEGAPLTS